MVPQEPAFFQNQLSHCKEPDARSVHWVIKLGGSLFDLNGLHEKILELVNCLPREGTVWLVPGGGRFADEVRRLDPIHEWPVEMSHRLAMQTMSLAAEMLSVQHERFLKVHSLDVSSADSDFRNVVRVVDVVSLSGVESLPPTWDLTSDSIAGWVAQQLPESHLVLAKSVALPEPRLGLQRAVEQGLVDRLFPEYVRRVRAISWVNLRAENPALQRWEPIDSGESD